MAHTRKYSARICSLAGRYVLTVGFLLAASSLAIAAPVTFRFEAEISQVQGDVAALNLPFPLAVGQKFKGQYEFQSEQELLDLFLHPPSNEALVRLFLAEMELQAVTNFGTLNDGGPIDINNLPPPGPVSSLSLGYVSLTDVFPGWGGNYAGFPFGVSLALAGPQGIIEGPDDILDVVVWNQLNTTRQLNCQFGYFLFGDFNVVSVRAIVGDFILVPEPSNILQVCVLIAIGVAYFFATRLFGLQIRGT